MTHTNTSLDFWVPWGPRVIFKQMNCYKFSAQEFGYTTSIEQFIRYCSQNNPIRKYFFTEDEQCIPFDKKNKSLFPDYFSVIDRLQQIVIY